MTHNEIRIDLNQHDLNEVRNILKKVVPHLEVWAFGSRVAWTAKSYSDLDLALLTEKPLSIDEFALIKESFDDSSLIVKVDIVDWAKTSDNFRNIIEKQKVVLQHASSHATWTPYKIAELGKVITGKTPKNTASTVGNQFPFITPPDFNGQKWIHNPTRSVSVDAAKTVKNNVIPAKSVMVTCIGSDMGKAAINSEACLTNQQINSIVVDESKFSPEFIYYNLSLRQEEIKQMAGGSAQPILNKSAFSEIWISCPSLKSQESIVSLLRPLDDRIALLRETNATLEAIAQALFKSWFVDFDPVHANAGTQAPSLPPEIQALFPATFTESPQGPIPEGWSWKTLDEAYEINPKRLLKKGVLAKYLDMASVQTRGHVTEEVIDREFGSGTKFCNGDTLLARITPCLENGKTAFVDFLGPNETGWGSTEFVVLKPKAPLPDFHGYLLARQSVFREFAIRSMSGTSGRQRVQNDVLGSFNLAMPDEPIATAFSQVVTPIQQSISANHKQAKTLANLRDTLLPRLISGQLRLPEAQAAIEEMC